MRGGLVVVGLLVLAALSGCGRTGDGADHAPTAASPLGPVTATESPAATPRVPTATPTVTTCPAEPPGRLSLVGDQGRAFAFAPLDRSGVSGADGAAVTIVEGEVDGSEAWSTSKVLVVAAFLDTTAAGDPERLGRADRRLIAAALSRSDAGAVRALRQQIPGRPGRAMTDVLRSIGDRQTTAPDSLEGTMAWSLRAQVRFMAALAADQVVSAATSRYLRESMQPIPEHRWGLGRVGATVFKGGWLRQGRVTRQMGLLNGYAVAIITDRGPVVRQTDGDAAHVRASDELAALLADRLDWERRCR